jgi:hypothetical protein
MVQSAKTTNHATPSADDTRVEMGEVRAFYMPFRLLAHNVPASCEPARYSQGGLRRALAAGLRL